jgi:glycosyltransferase involved in cell wall biosynthesis
MARLLHEKQHISTPLDIIMADETLRGAYLLRVAARPSWRGFDEESAAQFLLWFAFEGRHDHQQVRISLSYLAFLSEPVAPYATRLMAYLFLRSASVRDRLGRDPEAFHAWYYTTAVDEYRLAPLISTRERADLHAVHPRFASQARPLSRLEVYHYRSSPEIQSRFDLDRPADCKAYQNWFRARHLPGLPPFARIAPMSSGLRHYGVNVLGFANGVLGIGEDVRAISSALLRAGCPLSIHNISLTERIATSSQFGWDGFFSRQPVYPVNVFCLPPFEMVRLKIEHGSHLFDGRYNIGYWPWELTTLPVEWHFAFDLVDEVWAPSRYLADVYAAITAKPVHHVPPYLEAEQAVSFSRSEIGLTENDFVVLTMFDFNSFVARKNPQGAIEAFLRAFPASAVSGHEMGRSERLVIKTLNDHAHPDALASLRSGVAHDPRITFITEALPRDRVTGLIQMADCFLSLHRAEGFGRGLAEAMQLGTPVVATGWSGNMSFMDDETSFPVDYRLIDVPVGDYIFREGSRWAEPSIDDAARQLMRVRNDPDNTKRIAVAARKRIEAGHALDTIATGLLARLRHSEPAIASSQRAP